jgi:hypothetical protein
MLLLESEVAANSAESSGGRGEIAHFYAVSSYILQHPNGMNYTAEALSGLRQNLADHLAGRATLAQLRHRVRSIANGERRVTRRAGEGPITWPVQSWPLTVVDVIAGGVHGYTNRATDWAASIVDLLDNTTSKA